MPRPHECSTPGDLADRRTQRRLLRRDGTPPRAIRGGTGQVRRNVAASERLLDEGCEALVSTASGCGTFAKDYGHVLRHADASIAAAGARVGAATRDLCEVIDPAALAVAVATAARHASRSGSPGRRPARSSMGSDRRRRARSKRCCVPPAVNSSRLATRPCAAVRQARTRSCNRNSRASCARASSDSLLGDQRRRSRRPTSVARAPASGKSGAGAALDRDRRRPPLRLKRILSDVGRSCDAWQGNRRVACCARHSAAGTLLRQESNDGALDRSRRR